MTLDSDAVEGLDTRMTRAYGRAARGQRALGKVPWGHWRRLTVIGALGLEGVRGAMSIPAATSTVVFVAFVEQVLIPALQDPPDALVVMDNLPAHKAEMVRNARTRAGLSHRYLPPYSPDLGPIAVRTAMETRQPDRTGLVQAQDPAARRRRPLAGGAGSRPRSRSRHHHPQDARHLFHLCGDPAAN